MTIAPVPDWKDDQFGFKYLGIVTESVNLTVERLKNAGYELDHWGGVHLHLRSVYFIDDNKLEIEFIEYLTDDLARRNDYSR